MNRDNRFWIVLSLIFSIGLVVFFFIRASDQNPNSVNKETSLVDPQNSFSKASPTIADRKPSSIPSKKINEKREVLSTIKVDPSALTIVNEEKEWLNQITSVLRESMGPDAQIDITHEKSVIVPQTHSTGYLAEVVAIRINHPELGRYGYRALIDSHSGRIISTWDRTIYEGMAAQRKHKGFTLDMFGQIKL